MADNVHKVLFVDDEQYRVGLWKRALASKFDLVAIDAADDVISYFQEYDDVMAIVLDVMMPPPEGVASGRTGDGQLTGIYLLEALREKIEGLPCPVVMLSNRGKGEIQAEVDELQLRKGLVVVHHKGDTGAEDLVVLVEQIINRWN